MSTPAEQLAEINTAINKILYGGQSYKIGSRSMTRADLATLYAMKKELESAVNAEADGGGFGRGVAVGIFEGR